jgi:protein-S-isoprenylcysteine O-methyltransferase Ste14
VRILIPLVGSRGDVQPGVALGLELERRGHTVVVGAPPNFVDFVGRAGLKARQFGPDVHAVGDLPRKVGSFLMASRALTETSMRNCAVAKPDRLITYVLRTLLAVGVVALAGAVATHAIGGRFGAATYVVVYLAWALSEARITVGTPSQSAAENRTLVPYAAARVTTALTAAYSEPVVSVDVGIVLAGVFLAGVTLRAWAIRELGARYSHRVVRISESGLVCSGPYRVLRHPAYAGMLLANIGFVSYFASPASIVALTLLAATILWRIRVEEAVLVRSPGYREFASTRRRFVPGVW